jgi:gamma-glutamylcyclotransferase (GGCT)/AIG2-like uncharacterized protein YtfP
MNPHLFVYGTLLSGAAHPMGARLQLQARLVGEASLGGRLYDLGSYPGLVETADAHQRVEGEVYTLDSPASALKWLDAYEGIVPGNHDQSDYERVERPVRLASGEELSAWVYLYRRNVRPGQAIPGGRWLQPR